KLVSWRASARRPGGDLLVRQNAEGSPRRLWVLLRLSAASTPAQTEAALSTASSIIRAAAAVGGTVRGLRVGLSIRTDWAGADGRAADFDILPRTGGASAVLLNDLALLVVPKTAVPGLAVSGDPRLAASDIVIRVSPVGRVDAPATGTASRRLAAHIVSAGGVA
ncbi:MAG TPA: DUF58 domain-containing protein, partial [Phycisphaerales bacterium]|nr:DUF58 domain-containing protein [Phycisphaerales bacterium]